MIRGSEPRFDHLLFTICCSYIFAKIFCFQKSEDIFIYFNVAYLLLIEVILILKIKFEI